MKKSLISIIVVILISLGMNLKLQATSSVDTPCVESHILRWKNCFIYRNVENRIESQIFNTDECKVSQIIENKKEKETNETNEIN